MLNVAGSFGFSATGFDFSSGISSSLRDLLGDGLRERDLPRVLFSSRPLGFDLGDCRGDLESVGLGVFSSSESELSEVAPPDPLLFDDRGMVHNL